MKTPLSIPQLKKKVQRAVNAYVRERDKELPCISCQRFANNYDAGHYINQGSSGALRYNLDNIHKQCSFNCNRSLSGNKIEYRINLVKKIGVDRVEWLEDHRHDVKKWRREELEEILDGLKKEISYRITALDQEGKTIPGAFGGKDNQFITIQLRKGK